jgi:hypothetical protein
MVLDKLTTPCYSSPRKSALSLPASSAADLSLRSPPPHNAPTPRGLRGQPKMYLVQHASPLLLRFQRHQSRQSADDGGRHHSPPLTPFRINTCKSVTKQTTLTVSRINTYAKTGGGPPPMQPPPALIVCEDQGMVCWDYFAPELWPLELRPSTRERAWPV